MKVYLAADHAGGKLALELAQALAAQGHEAVNLSPASRTDDDYPDVIAPLAERIATEPGAIGIAIGASGQGEAMVANRTRGVRAAVYYGEAAHAQVDAAGHALGILESARAHNDANILSLGARFLSTEEAVRAVETFLATPFSGEERHVRRIAEF